jgi:hypothetical protein
MAYPFSFASDPVVGKGLHPLIGWSWSWRSSLLSCASAALVGTVPLLARQLLRGLVFIARLRLSSAESPAGCWRSRPFGRSRSSRAETVGTPGMPAGILPGPWCAPEVIPTTLTPETGEVSWASMGLRRVLLLAEVLPALIEVPGLWSDLVSLVAEAGPCGVLPTVSGRAGSGMRSGWRLRTGALPLGNLRRLRGWTETPLVCTPSRHVQSAPAHDLLRQPRRLPDLYAIVVCDERG